uniref:Uncharacterized protein n=1 Tax=Vitrella brassicaformis TaxID=1169539 RepID=A0A7S1KHL3_9ALVE
MMCFCGSTHTKAIGKRPQKTTSGCHDMKGTNRQTGGERQKKETGWTVDRGGWTLMSVCMSLTAYGNRQAYGQAGGGEGAASKTRTKGIRHTTQHPSMSLLSRHRCPSMPFPRRQAHGSKQKTASIRPHSTRPSVCRSIHCTYSAL